MLSWPSSEQQLKRHAARLWKRRAVVHRFQMRPNTDACTLGGTSSFSKTKYEQARLLCQAGVCWRTEPGTLSCLDSSFSAHRCSFCLILFVGCLAARTQTNLYTVFWQSRFQCPSSSSVNGCVRRASRKCSMPPHSSNRYRSVCNSVRQNTRPNQSCQVGINVDRS